MGNLRESRNLTVTGLSSRNFFRGRAKSIVMQISFVMLIFLLLWDQVSGGRGKLPQEGRPSLPKKARVTVSGHTKKVQPQQSQTVNVDRRPLLNMK